jgi:hypothetical protein
MEPLKLVIIRDGEARLDHAPLAGDPELFALPRSSRQGADLHMNDQYLRNPTLSLGI